MWIGGVCSILSNAGIEDDSTCAILEYMKILCSEDLEYLKKLTV